MLTMRRPSLQSIGLGIMGIGMVAAGIACSSAGPDVPDSDDQVSTDKVHIKADSQEVHLRAGFDADPSPLIGRFIEDGVQKGEIDETDGVQTRCSRHIEAKTVRAGGTFDKIYRFSSEAAARLGLKSSVVGGNVSAGAGQSQGAVVRVKYDLNKKMRGIKTDQYYKCCRRHVGACSGRYISEFWKGTGEIYQAVGSEKGFKASGNVPTQGGGEIEFKQGVAWKRARTFEKMYFAFKVSDSRIQDDCGWVDQPPTAEDGKYFVGVSPPVPTETQSKSLAMRDARKQVVRYLGESIEVQSKSVSSAVKGYLKDREVLETAAKGVAEHVKDRRWCGPETQKSPDGTLYKSQVLAFFPETNAEKARKATIQSLEKALQQKGDLSDEDQKMLDKLKKAIPSDS